MMRYTISNSIFYFSFCFFLVGISYFSFCDAILYDKPFVDHCVYDESVPTPSEYLNYPFATRPVTYDETLNFFQMLDELKENIELVEYGETHEGRKLLILIVSSPENMSNLNVIKEHSQKLFDPRMLHGEQEANKILEKTPAIAWMAYSIHGDELSSTDAAIWLAYQLAAGQNEMTKRILDDTIVIIDPLQNPDGRERFLAQIRMFSGEIQNPDVQSAQHAGVWPWGRGNHYLYDLNRDYFILSQPETRARVKALLEWHPHLFVDSHEMGALNTYLFSPPREPINHNLTPMHDEWAKIFAADQADAFNQHGWSYYTREWLDMWYPGYTEWIAYSGALQIIYEQAGVDGSAVRRPDGTTMTYQETVHHHITSSLANLTTLAQNRKEFLKDYFAEKKKTVQPLNEEEARAYLIEPGDNPMRDLKLIENLLWQGFEIEQAKEPFSAGNLVTKFGEKIPHKEFQKGTWIISTQQPQKNVINAVLEFDPRLTDSFLAEERYSLEKKGETRLYDVSSWSMPIAYAVNCFQAVESIQVSRKRVDKVEPNQKMVPAEKPKYGYVLPGNDDATTHAIVKLLEKGYAVRVADKEFQCAGVSFPKGGFLLRNVENPKFSLDDFRNIIEETGAQVHLADSALDLKLTDLGGQHFLLLHPPRIGVFMGRTVNTTSYGTTWDLLDRVFQTRVSSLDVDRISSLDLRKYNVLIFPSTARSIPEGSMKALKGWVENGGTLIAMGVSVSQMTNPKAEMSAVRERGEVLDQLDVYMEWIEREEEALQATANQEDVWDYSPEEVEGATKAEKSNGKNQNKEKLKRQDDWERRFAPHGAFLQTTTDPEHWLAFGVKSPLAVMVQSARSYYAKPPVDTVVRFTEEETIRVSGLLWPEARKRFAKSAYLTRERRGKGQIILFPFEPNSRGYYPETTRLLWNAIFIAPGAGAQQPIPW